MKDIIVEEIRLSRTEHAKKFNFDIHAICKDIRKTQQSCGHSVFRESEPYRVRYLHLQDGKSQYPDWNGSIGEKGNISSTVCIYRGNNQSVKLTFYTPEVTRMLEMMSGEMSRKEIQEKMQLKDPDHFRKAYIDPALVNKLIEMTLPEWPRSSKQRYRLTRKGVSFLGSNLNNHRYHEYIQKQSNDYCIIIMLQAVE